MPRHVVHDLSFIETRPVKQAQALPSARTIARENKLDLQDIQATGSYISKDDVHTHIEKNTYPAKNDRCTFITASLDCVVGGFGHLGCLDEKFNERCQVRHRVNKLLLKKLPVPE